MKGHNMMLHTYTPNQWLYQVSTFYTLWILNYSPENILKVKVTKARSKVNSRSHHDISHLHLCHVCSGGQPVTHFPSGDGGGEMDLSHVCSRDYSVTHDPSGGWGGEEDLSHVCSEGHSVTHVSGGWGRRGGVNALGDPQ